MEKIKAKRKVKPKKKSFNTRFKWLFVFILCTQFLQLSAQTPTINLTMKQVSLHEILMEIKKQSGKNIVFNNNLIEKYNNESIELKNVKLEDALKKVCEGKELKYRIVDDVIIIEPSDNNKDNNSDIQSTLKQTILGSVSDNASDMPLIGATIIVEGTNPARGAITDENGNFKIEKVPLGRFNIVVRYVGYEPYLAKEVLVGSGKEVILNPTLKESFTQLDEVRVTPNSNKEQSINSMTSVSARQFSVEETQRYAGGFNDPGRLASSFAGVANSDVESNGIVVRGNSPTGSQWRVEGTEVTNPNHFAGSKILGGGFVSFFSNQLLANSDFLTGAFPAEYGNALSAVFDIKLRNGNPDKHEYVVQTGVMGIDLTAEGPFNKKTRSTYLVNYRYSTFGLVQNFLPEGEGLPIYQDLCFKLNFPTKAGVFSFWGAGATDDYYEKADNNPDNWNMLKKRQEQLGEFNTAISGISHKYLLKSDAYINSSLVYSINNKKMDMKWMHDNLVLYDQVRMDLIDQQLSFSTFINKKFSSRHSNRTGMVIRKLGFKYFLLDAPRKMSPLDTVANENGYADTYQFYTQSKINISPSLITNIGVHFHYFGLNGSKSVEPRIGLQWLAFKKTTISFAYGNHSKIQEMGYYLFKDSATGANVLPNKNLGFSKAHHFVLGFDYKINENTRIKIEPYYQYLYNIPVTEDSSFSAINLVQYDEIKSKLVNKGTGTNIGIDLTLERFLQKGYYYMVTVSIFDSKYKGGDNIERNTRFNKKVIANVLGGKEWYINKGQKNQIIGVNGRIYYYGGDWASPVKNEASLHEKKIVYDDTRAFEVQQPSTLRFDLGLSYRINKSNYSNVFELQIMNVFGSAISYRQNVDFVKNEIVEQKVKSTLPSISWKIEF
jgi:hypothetical protein